MSIIKALARALGLRKTEVREKPKKQESKVMTREERLAFARQLNMLANEAAFKRDECERLKRIQAEGMSKCMEIIGSAKR